MDEHLDLIDEQKRMHERIILLDNYIQGLSALNSVPFDQRAHHDQMLMHIQLAAMRSYAVVLDQRLVHLKPNTV